MPFFLLVGILAAAFFTTARLQEHTLARNAKRGRSDFHRIVQTGGSLGRVNRFRRLILGYDQTTLAFAFPYAIVAIDGHGKIG